MITLFVENGIAYVWNSDDWHVLRSQHRICGSLFGSIASYPRQNDFLGLPMALMSEETALLVEKNICELVELPNICDKPSTEEKTDIQEFEKRTLKEQTEALRKRKIEQLSQKIEMIVAGKKKKMQSQGMAVLELDKQALLQDEINKLPKLLPIHILVHTPTEHYINTDKRSVSIDALRPSVVNREGSLRYSIFKDLWERGHYITSGSKFGSEYLVYPGEPVRFHASYMVRCIYDKETLFSPPKLVAFGRLSVAVNKMAVLAFCDTNGGIEYQTLQWHDST